MSIYHSKQVWWNNTVSHLASIGSVLVLLAHGQYCLNCKYRKIYNIRRTLVGYNIIDHSDVVGASPVGAAPTTS